MRTAPRGARTNRRASLERLKAAPHRALAASERRARGAGAVVRRARNPCRPRRRLGRASEAGGRMPAVLGTAIMLIRPSDAVRELKTGLAKCYEQVQALLT